MDNIKPRLITGVDHIKFTDTIFFLRNNTNGNYCKVSADEAAIARKFDGTRSISDILQEQLDASGTGLFGSTLDLIVRLNSGGFLEEDCRPLLKELKVENEHRQSPGLLKIKLPFNGFFSKNIGIVLGSIAALFIIMMLAIVAFSYSPVYHGVNILGIFSNYFYAFVFIWLSASVILSAKYLLSAFIVAGSGAKVLNSSIKIIFGCPCFYCEPTDIISAGTKPAVKLYLFRMFFPFALAGCAALLWNNGFSHPAVAIFHHTAIVIGFIGVSPLFHSDLMAALSMFRMEAGHASSFLRKKFITELFSFKSHSPEQKYYIALSALAMLWLYYFYVFFWSLIKSSLAFLMADLLDASVPGMVIILILAALIVAPFIALLSGAVIIILSNLHSISQTPLRSMTKLANDISSRKVPAKEQVIDFLKMIPLFSKLDDQDMAVLCSHISLKTFGKGRNIIVQGEKGESFYTIVSGRVQVQKEAESGTVKIIDTLTTGDCFGETALIEHVPRTATIQTLEKTVVFELERSYFEQFVISSAGGKEKVTDMIRLGKMLPHIGVFEFLSPSQLSSIILRLKEEKFTKGSMIFNQGETGDKFYIIKEGSVLIEHKETGAQGFNKKLGKNDFFGEIAIIRHIPRTASAVAETDTDLYSLTKNDFQDILRHSILAGIELDSVLRKRTAELGQEAIKACFSK